MRWIMLQSCWYSVWRFVWLTARRRLSAHWRPAGGGRCRSRRRRRRWESSAALLWRRLSLTSWAWRSWWGGRCAPPGTWPARPWWAGVSLSRHTATTRTVWWVSAALRQTSAHSLQVPLTAIAAENGLDLNEVGDSRYTFVFTLLTADIQARDRLADVMSVRNVLDNLLSDLTQSWWVICLSLSGEALSLSLSQSSTNWFQAPVSSPSPGSC